MSFSPDEAAAKAGGIIPSVDQARKFPVAACLVFMTFVALAFVYGFKSATNEATQSYKDHEDECQEERKTVQRKYDSLLLLSYSRRNFDEDAEVAAKVDSLLRDKLEEKTKTILMK